MESSCAESVNLVQDFRSYEWNRSELHRLALEIIYNFLVSDQSCRVVQHLILD